MKILLIIDDITIGGGAERVVVNLANAFNAMRFDFGKYRCAGGKPQIEVLSLRNKNKNIPYSIKNGVRVIYYHDLCDLPLYKADIKTIKGCYKRFYTKSKVLLYKLIFLIKFYRFVGTTEILQRRLNAIISKNQYDFVIDNTWANFYPFRKNTNTQYIKILHSSVALQRIHQPESFFVGLKAFDCLVYMTSQIDIWQRYHSNIKVIPNFLPTIPQVATNHSQKVVLSVGRMSSEKGFLRLLDIWKMVQTKIKDSPSPAESHSFCSPSLAEGARGRVDSISAQQNPPPLSPSAREGEIEDLSQWKLIIVGDGVLKGEIESKIRALNLGESVILKPFTKDIEREYLSASIYAMASHFEGFPMVLLESTAYGLAPISFDIATGPSDIIEHNKSGFLIADNDLESYADKLIALMSDESMRVRFGKEAKRIVSERFSKEVIMQKWREVFEG